MSKSLERLLDDAYDIALNKLSGLRLNTTNGHFAELVSLSRGIELEKSQAKPVIDKSAIVNYLSHDYPNGQSHNAQLDDLATLYVKPLVNRLGTLRNDIIPFVTQICNEIDKIYTRETVTQLEIVPIDIPNIYFNDYLVKTLARHERYSTISTKNIKFMGGFNVRNEMQVMNLIETNSTVLNDGLTELIASYPEGWVADVYKRYFVEGGILPSNITKDMRKAYADEAVICYIITNNMILKNIVDGSVNISLNDYQTYLTNLLTALGGYLYIMTIALQRVAASDELVSHIDRSKGVVYVFKNNYERYLTDGGSVDALCGALISSNVAYGKNILDNKLAYTEAYERHYDTKIKALRISFLTKMKAIFGKVFMATFPKQSLGMRAMLGTILNNEQYNPNNPSEGHIQELFHIISSSFDTVPEDNIFEMVIKGILTKGIFAQYKLYDVYLQLDQLMRSRDESYRVTDAAFMIAIKEIVDAVVDSSIAVSR